MFDNIDETVFFKTAKAPPHHIGNLKKKKGKSGNLMRLPWSRMSQLYLIPFFGKSWNAKTVCLNFL